jgi:hypothetical protein
MQFATGGSSEAERSASASHGPLVEPGYAAFRVVNGDIYL